MKLAPDGKHDIQRQRPHARARQTTAACQMEAAAWPERPKGTRDLESYRARTLATSRHRPTTSAFAPDHSLPRHQVRRSFDALTGKFSSLARSILSLPPANRHSATNDDAADCTVLKRATLSLGTRLLRLARVLVVVSWRANSST